MHGIRAKNNISVYMYIQPVKEMSLFGFIDYH